jgi:SAM-dependent methyltransferase
MAARRCDILPAPGHAGHDGRPDIRFPLVAARDILDDMPDIVTGPEEGDAFGRALLDRLDGINRTIVLERDDGFTEADESDYLAGWNEHDSWAVQRVRGRVLDVGAGAGRASLALQARGHEVVALDVSAGAIEACRRRGVNDVFLGTMEDLAASGTEPFDSVLALGNNLGLLGSAEGAGDVLNALGAVLRPGGVIVGTCIDPYQTSDDVHLAYHQRNRDRARMPGQCTIRVRYRRLATGWFDLLWMSITELGELVAPAGWRIAEVLPGPVFGAVLART